MLLQKMTRIMEGNAFLEGSPFEKGSLNKEARKKELLKITMENQVTDSPSPPGNSMKEPREAEPIRCSEMGRGAVQEGSSYSIDC